jgi:hypothetical protein
MKIQQHLASSNAVYVKRRIEDVARAINGQIEFGNPTSGPVNISGTWVKTQTPGANVEFTVKHNLGRMPNGMLVASLDQAAMIYASRLASWTTTQAFFKCSVASVNLVGFVF